jgi:hypothetical protein
MALRGHYAAEHFPVITLNHRTVAWEKSMMVLDGKCVGEPATMKRLTTVAAVRSMKVISGTNVMEDVITSRQKAVAWKLFTTVPAGIPAEIPVMMKN